jgi:alanine racemase
VTFLARSGSTVAEIDLTALLHNLSEVRRVAGTRAGLLAAVKADAYGHGAIEVSRALERGGVSMLGVARIEEGIELREAGIEAPILVLSGVPVGGTAPSPFETLEQRLDELLHFRLTPMLYDIGLALAMDRLLQKRQLAREVGESGPPANLDYHLKVDSGMGRIGIPANDVRDAIATLSRLKHLRLTGAATHFADADGTSAEAAAFTRAQVATFHETVAPLRGISDQLQLHASNSAAALGGLGGDLDLIRPGIALYGASPFDVPRAGLALAPVMRLTTRVLFVKDVPAGTPISYGRTFVTTRPSRIATLPVGYADGYPRSLSNRGEVLIRGRRAPVAGRVCMDLTMVDVTGIPDVAAGDEAVLIGSSGDARMPAEEVASKAGTISYEILVQVSKRVPRVYRSEPR